MGAARSPCLQPRQSLGHPGVEAAEKPLRSGFAFQSQRVQGALGELAAQTGAGSRDRERRTEWEAQPKQVQAADQPESPGRGVRAAGTLGGRWMGPGSSMASLLGEGKQGHPGCVHPPGNPPAVHVAQRQGQRPQESAEWTPVLACCPGVPFRF